MSLPPLKLPGLLLLHLPGQRLVLSYRRGTVKVNAHWRRGIEKRDSNPISRFLRLMGEMSEVERQGWLLVSEAISKRFKHNDASVRLYEQLLKQNTAMYDALSAELPSLTKKIGNYNPHKGTKS